MTPNFLALNAYDHEQWIARTTSLTFVIYLTLLVSGYEFSCFIGKSLVLLSQYPLVICCPPFSSQTVLFFVVFHVHLLILFSVV